jgi:hypothetical protein
MTLPFEEEDDDAQSSPQKVTLKKVSSQKSMFDGTPKKQSAEDFERKVHQIQERSSGYKAKAADLALQFSKMMNDKTIANNKNVFAQEVERDVLSKMIQLAVEINNDPYEQEGMGSLSWITLLFKTCLSQRDRINKLEYCLLSLDKKLDSKFLSDLISKEIKQALDKQKSNE